MTSMSLNNALDILTINIPVQYKRRSSRKIIMTPDGLPLSKKDQEKIKPDNSFVTAIMRAFSWQEKLENGTYSSHKEMAEKEKMDITYMYRTMRLTLLAPDIIESILKGAQPRDLTLQNIVRGFPISWHEQRQKFGFPPPEK